MKGLATLIKLQKNKLDALRTRITKLEDQKALQEQMIHYLQLQLEEEELQATEHAHLSQFFGDFRVRIRNQQETARLIIKDLNVEIAALQRQMADAFGELKKLEITQEHIKARETERRNKLEQEMLDEIALQQYMRQET